MHSGCAITCFKDVEDIIAQISFSTSLRPAIIARAHSFTQALAASDLASTTFQDFHATTAQLERSEMQSDCGLKRTAATSSRTNPQLTRFLGAPASSESCKRLRAAPSKPIVSSLQELGSGTVTELLEPSVMLTVFRAGAVLEIGVLLGKEDGMGTGRIVHWCGAQIQVGQSALVFLHVCIFLINECCSDHIVTGNFHMVKMLQISAFFAPVHVFDIFGCFWGVDRGVLFDFAGITTP